MIKYYKLKLLNSLMSSLNINKSEANKLIKKMSNKLLNKNGIKLK